MGECQPLKGYGSPCFYRVCRDVRPYWKSLYICFDLSENRSHELETLSELSSCPRRATRDLIPYLDRVGKPHNAELIC